MIFIGGLQPRTRTLEKTPRTCPSCGLPRALLKRTDHYISLFFIPLIPVSRGEPFLACDGCGGIFDERGQGLIPPKVGKKLCPGCRKAVEAAFTYCPYCGRRV